MTDEQELYILALLLLPPSSTLQLTSTRCIREIDASTRICLASTHMTQAEAMASLKCTDPPKDQDQIAIVV